MRIVVKLLIAAGLGVVLTALSVLATVMAERHPTENRRLAESAALASSAYHGRPLQF